MRHLLYILVFTSSLAGFGQAIDPTGSFQLNSSTKKKAGEVYGYTGEIQVKAISNDKVVLRMYVNRGAPSYNSAYLLDTLVYSNNQIIYTCPAADPSCKITFTYTKKGITVVEETADFNTGCGFGRAVMVTGMYKRISSKVPDIKALPAGAE